MSNLAFIFPGQGAQFIGMGKELADAFPVAKAVFDEVDDALDQKLSALMWSGDADELTLTSNTQPALMAVSVAAARALEAEHGIGMDAAKFVAGHSLGEYSALAAARALQVDDTARLLRIRGNAMQDAVPAGVGAMAALLGADVEQAEAACSAGAAHGVCEFANDNAPGQIVISGDKAAVEVAAKYAEDNGVKKAMMLAVSAPFHCSLMQPAADAMMNALANVEVKAPVVPVVANVIAEANSDPALIKDHLVQQVTGRVRWRESVAWMHGQGTEMTGELGAGKVLTVMNRRNVKAIKGKVLGTPDELAAFADFLKNPE